MAQRCRNFRRDSSAPLHPHVAARDADPPSHVLHLTFSHLHVITRAALFSSRFAVRALLRKVTMTESSRCTDAASSPTSISRVRVSCSRQPISGLSSPSLRYATIRVSECLRCRSAINIISDKTRTGIGSGQSRGISTSRKGAGSITLDHYVGLFMETGASSYFTDAIRRDLAFSSNLCCTGRNVYWLYSA